MSSIPRRLAALVAIVFAFSFLTACGGSGGNDTPAPGPTLSTLHNDLPGGELIKVHEFKDEPFSITTAYSTNYNTAAWKITDSKLLHYSVRLTTSSPDSTVFVEHVHADVSMSANQGSEFNGMQQDSIDDHLHTGDQAGVEVTAKHSYDDDFAIEGYSPTLISGWGFAVGGYGASEINDDRLTEGNLKDNGVTGNKIVFVYKLLVKNPGDKFFHDEEFYDEFLVNTAK